MESNTIEEFPTDKNFRTVNFVYNEQKYEINVSLYSNAILAFISFNGKISNIYELNLDEDEEQEVNDFNYMGDNEEDNIKDIALAQCILGKRGNEHMDFIANFIITYIKDIIIKVNNKINRICLSLCLDNNLLKNIEDRNMIKNFLDTIKDNVGKIFNITKK